MTQAAFDRRHWQAVIGAHPLESHDPTARLRYGVALLQTIALGPAVGRQQQQAALAFVQARKEGATAEDVAVVQRQAALLSLREALDLVGIVMPGAPPGGVRLQHDLLTVHPLGDGSGGAGG